jgi:hypothetical protein
LLAPRVIVDIVGCCWRRVAGITLLASRCWHCGLLTLWVIAGIAGYCWHCGLLPCRLLALRVADTVGYFWHRRLLLALWVIVGITDCCWHCGLLLASQVIVGIVGCCWHCGLLTPWVIAGIVGYC